MTEAAPATDREVAADHAAPAAVENGSADQVRAKTRSVVAAAIDWGSAHVKTVIGSISLAGIATAVLLGLGFKVEEPYWLYGLIYRENVSGAVNLQPDRLTLQVANSGHEAIEIAFENVEVHSTLTGATVIPKEQMSWEQGSSEEQPGRLQVSRYNGSLTRHASARSMRGEELTFFIEGERCEFTVTLQVAGEVRTSKPCRCGAQCKLEAD